MSVISENKLKDRLKNLAKAQKVTVNELLKRLYLERFLARLSKSDYSDKLIFKGGNLLNYYLNIRRQTYDLDFLVNKLKVEESSIQKVFEEICQAPIDDGFELKFDKMSSLDHEHMSYPGFRLIVKIKLKNGALKDNLQIDLGVGDKVTPEYQALTMMAYKDEPFYEESVSLMVYPPEVIFAEKLETVIARGDNNSRTKDFHDLILMIRKNDFLNKEKPQASIEKTFDHRGTELKLPLAFDSNSRLHSGWAAHGVTLGPIMNQLQFPAQFDGVVDEINQYLKKTIKNKR